MAVFDSCFDLIEGLFGSQMEFIANFSLEFCIWDWQGVHHVKRSLLLNASL